MYYFYTPSYNFSKDYFLRLHHALRKEGSFILFSLTKFFDK
jgi:hypothetical protein